jgi:hypothetical protein
MALTIDGPLPELAGNDDTSPRAGAGLVVSGAAADVYVERLVRAIRGARLNALFPPERALCAHLDFLPPSGCEELYSELCLAPQSGLPAARDVLRVKIDRDLAAEFLRSAARRPEPAAQGRMARRMAYYRRLAGTEVMPLNRMRVELRTHVPENNLALFRVVLDRFDMAACTFVRYTILLGQRDRFWRRPHVVVDDHELAAPTEAFRRIVGRLVSDEAELAMVLLSRLEGVEVEDVRRCRVGPLLMPGARVGGALEALLDARRTPELGDEPRWILCFPEDRAGVEVAEHASRDPLAQLYREAVDADARAIIDAKADELRYRVAKSRKFVCPRALCAPLATLCRELGAPSIVRGA